MSSSNSIDHTVLKVLAGIITVVGASFMSYSFIMGEVENRLTSINTDVQECLTIAKENEKTILIRTKYMEDGNKAINRLGRVEAQVNEMQFGNTDKLRRILRLEIGLANHEKSHEGK